MKQNDFYEVDGCTDFIPVKLIEEHKHIMNALELEVAESGFRTFAPNIYKFPKVDEPQKVTVPKFVAEWIKKYKEEGCRLSHALEDVFDDVELSLYIKQQEDDYTETIAEAWIAYPNITVEQEKLYTVKVLDSTLFKMTSDNHVRYKLIGENEIPSESKIDNYTFEANLTEKEIKEADERLWQFAKEMEEG
ncbi:DUF1642 domain-containing protein [Streptococcus thermophilus]|uniref:DUF1642 domain-containing protein n=1 Tax=Streptococcus thermophilus TaxID=1308 RepID=UPI002181F7BA|nr:DUF1642 domain-containing protein [Streptococcus thermophilus]MCS9993920.1 DUF1642 domain-containing protein [Streptococcus thermophilus]